MKSLTWMFVVVVLILAGSCKKKDSPFPEPKPKPEEEITQPELVLLVEKMTLKEFYTLTPPDEPAFEQELIHHYIPEYSADSLLVKVTVQFEPSAVFDWSSAQDTYDSYEYEAGRLVKHNLYRRRNTSPQDPIELVNYYTYTYNEKGNVNSTSFYSSRRVPPNGDFAFRETNQTTYQYDSQQRITTADRLSFDYVGDDGTVKISSWANRTEYVYNSDGNIEKEIGYFGFDANRDEVVTDDEVEKETETVYSGYSEHPNPAYHSGLLTTGNLLGLFPLFKHLPETAVKNAFNLPGDMPSTLTATDTYTTTYRDDGYPSHIQLELENKYLDQSGVVNTQKQHKVMEFRYRE